MQYFLDPDYRKEPPTGVPYCCRCQKPIKGEHKRVTVDYDSMLVMEDENGKELLELDCWKKISKQSPLNLHI